MNLQVITRATIALIIAVAAGTTVVSGQDSKPAGDKVSFECDQNLWETVGAGTERE